MENNKDFHVNIYYSEEEANAALIEDMNTLSAHSKVHVFTKNPSNLIRMPAHLNVVVHSAGSLWDRLKAWIAGEEQFQDEFSALNISTDDRERYRNIILNGGTIVLTSSNEMIDSLFATHDAHIVNDPMEETLIGADPDLTSSEQLKEEEETGPDRTAQLFASEDYAEHDLKNGSAVKHNTNGEFTEKEKSFFHDGTDNHVEETEKKSYPRVPGEASDQPGDVLSHVETYETMREETPEHQKHPLENLDEKQARYDEKLAREERMNKASHTDTNDELPKVYEDNLNAFETVKHRNIPTDSTESVWDDELRAKLGDKVSEGDRDQVYLNDHDTDEEEILSADEYHERKYLDEESPKHPRNHYRDELMGDAAEHRRHDLP